MYKLIAEEKARAGLWHAVACPNVTGRTEEKMVQSKRARAGSLVIVNYLQEVVARTTCILRADLVLPFSAVRFVLLGFVFVILPFVESFFDMDAPRQPHTVTYLTTIRVLFRFHFFLFLFLWRYRFFRLFLYLFLFVWRVHRTINSTFFPSR